MTPTATTERQMTLSFESARYSPSKRNAQRDRIMLLFQKHGYRLRLGDFDALGLGRSGRRRMSDIRELLGSKDAIVRESHGPDRDDDTFTVAPAKRPLLDALCRQIRADQAHRKEQRA